MTKIPLKLKEIPTKNKLQIIDNYSPNYNYIVEDNKIYYARKGKDYWVDISDNNVARENLFRFLNDRYSFRGYDDREKEIYNLIQKKQFNYSTFGQKQPSTERGLPPRRQPASSTSTDYLHIDGSHLKSPFISDDPKLKSFEQAHKTPKIVQTDVRTGISTDAQGRKYKKTASGNYQRVVKPKLPQVNLDFLKVKTPGDMGAIWNQIVSGNWSDAWNTVSNGISRKWNKSFGSDPTSVMKLPQGAINKNSKYALRPSSFVGDTIPVPKSRRYIIPESLDMREFTFGARNRGNTTEIKSEAAPITAFNPFKPYGQQQKGFQTYIGIDPQGRFKVGDISQFSSGDLLTGTYANEVLSFKKDKAGNLQYKNDRAHGNGDRSVPITVLRNGKFGSLNILTNRDQTGNTYGWVDGGRVLVKVGPELRLLSGSIEDIERNFEDMKRRNKATYGTFYTLDNGSYNRGLRTYDRIFTPADLKEYDQQNVGGGNFLYIKNRRDQIPSFKSDTIWTPNVRTESDASYHKGHNLRNEQRGIVLHHTAFTEPSLAGVTQHLTKPNGDSAHVIIGYDGTRRVLARPNQVTFHAGASYWNGRDNVNDFMVGIEFQGDTSKKDLTNQQVESAVEYMTPIIRANNIRLEDIVTHQQVRDMYNDYAKRSNTNTAPSKPDISQSSYTKIIKRLKERLYYEK